MTERMIAAVIAVSVIAGLAAWAEYGYPFSRKVEIGCVMIIAACMAWTAYIMIFGA